nr:MAG: capsid protein [Virus sp.]
MYRRNKVRGRRGKRRNRRYSKVSKYRTRRTRSVAKKALRLAAKTARTALKRAYYRQYYQANIGSTVTQPTNVISLMVPGSAYYGWEANPVFNRNSTPLANLQRIRHKQAYINIQVDMANEFDITNTSIFILKPTKYGSQFFTYANDPYPTFVSQTDWAGTPGSILINKQNWKILWSKHYQMGAQVMDANYTYGIGTATVATTPRPVHLKYRLKLKTNCMLQNMAQGGATATWQANGGQPTYRWDNVYAVIFTDNSTTDGQSNVITMNILHQLEYA